MGGTVWQDYLRDDMIWSYLGASCAKESQIYWGRGGIGSTVSCCQRFIDAAAGNGWFDGEMATMESLMAFKRAGGRTSITMSGPAENTARIQRGRPFARGESGNPAGKPRGARNKVTVPIESLMGQYGQQVAARVVKRACDGDMTAARLILERVDPVRRRRPVR